jgi:uncharacterized iron-regulated membrane protein
MRQAFRVLHRYLSLGVMALWLLQAVTGVLLVFHWEIDDWGVAGPARPLQPVAFARGLDAMVAARPGDSLSGVYASGGLPGRFDVLLARPDGKTDALRVDGQGEVLRQRPWDHDQLHIGAFQIATYLHQTLFAHDLGKWFLGLSGALLLSNIGMGLTLAWPRAGQWRRTLLPAGAPRAPMKVLGWHRAAGLWLGLPALVTLSAGVIMAFETPLQGLFVTRPQPQAAVALAEPATGHGDAATAMVAALRLHPGARMSALEPPGAEAPWWTVGLRQPGEWRTIAGRTYVYVSSRSGRILAEADPLKAPLRTKFWDGLYAVHTGEAGGVAGRLAVTLIGLWLVCMCGLGLTLWALRRPRPRKDPS